MREVLFRFVSAFLVVATGIGGWLWLAYHALTISPLKVQGDALHYVVKPGMTLPQVAQDLFVRGVLRQPRALVWYARGRGKASQIKAGEYRIEPGTTPLQLLDRLITGKVVQHVLTLIEGWTFEEVRVAVQRHPKITQTLVGLNSDAVMGALGLTGVHPEGWFYPETYHFPSGMSDQAFLRRAHRTMVEKLQREWAERAEGLPFRTPYEALVLASIVEKETGMRVERPRIAGVFVRRLQKRMRLQSDPAVIYGVGEAFDGNLRRRDLQRDTPYNTYLRVGLPPTPIAMPSGDAIRAVLHPKLSDHLYFVAKGDGSHHFSATYEEHLRAVARYQLCRGTSDSVAVRP